MDQPKDRQALLEENLQLKKTMHKMIEERRRLGTKVSMLSHIVHKLEPAADEVRGLSFDRTGSMGSSRPLKQPSKRVELRRLEPGSTVAIEPSHSKSFRLPRQVRRPLELTSTENQKGSTSTAAATGIGRTITTTFKQRLRPQTAAVATKLAPQRVTVVAPTESLAGAPDTVSTVDDAVGRIGALTKEAEAQAHPSATASVEYSSKPARDRVPRQGVDSTRGLNEGLLDTIVGACKEGGHQTLTRDSAPDDDETFELPIGPHVPLSYLLGSIVSLGGSNASQGKLPLHPQTVKPTGSSSGVAHSEAAMLRLRSDVLEKSALVTSLQARCSSLQAAVDGAKRHADAALMSAESHRVQLRDTRTALQEALASIDSMKGRLTALEGADLELDRLRTLNRRLELQLADQAEREFYLTERSAEADTALLEKVASQEEALALHKRRCASMQESLQSKALEAERLLADARTLKEERLTAIKSCEAAVHARTQLEADLAKASAELLSIKAVAENGQFSACLAKAEVSRLTDELHASRVAAEASKAVAGLLSQLHRESHSAVLQIQQSLIQVRPAVDGVPVMTGASGSLTLPKSDATRTPDQAAAAPPAKQASKRLVEGHRALEAEGGMGSSQTARLRSYLLPATRQEGGRTRDNLPNSLPSPLTRSLIALEHGYSTRLVTRGLQDGFPGSPSSIRSPTADAGDSVQTSHAEDDSASGVTFHSTEVPDDQSTILSDLTLSNDDVAVSAASSSHGASGVCIKGGRSNDLVSRTYFSGAPLLNQVYNNSHESLSGSFLELNECQVTRISQMLVEVARQRLQRQRGASVQPDSEEELLIDSHAYIELRAAVPNLLDTALMDSAGPKPFLSASSTFVILGTWPLEALLPFEDSEMSSRTADLGHSFSPVSCYMRLGSSMAHTLEASEALRAAGGGLQPEDGDLRFELLAVRSLHSRTDSIVLASGLVSLEDLLADAYLPGGLLDVTSQQRGGRSELAAFRDSGWCDLPLQLVAPPEHDGGHPTPGGVVLPYPSLRTVADLRYSLKVVSKAAGWQENDHVPEMGKNS